MQYYKWLKQAKIIHYHLLTIAASLIVYPGSSTADEVNILSTEFIYINNDQWNAKVTLKHADSGWDHYADKWRIIDSMGKILATRTLYHPHIEEQPFTRGLENISIPNNITTVYVEAHDKLHGWSKKRLKIDLVKP